MEVNLAQFNGPLDLLLSLIEKRELDITDISLAEVTDQYLVFLKGNRRLPTDELADFLEIAAQLIMIKTRRLLPFLITEPDDDQPENLLRRLKNYAEIKNRTRKLRVAWFDDTRESREIFWPATHLTGAVHPIWQVISTGWLTGEILRQQMSDIVRRTNQQALPIQAIKRTYNLEQIIQRINDFLTRESRLPFTGFMSASPTRIEVIINFLALLELSKGQRVRLRQVAPFEVLMVHRYAYD